ncbi:MAG: c-type cytochrome [Deltaproteobacteria bacterium]|nr:c-type cytochrome [Deltaproteobacteria bacterium]
MFLRNIAAVFLFSLAALFPASSFGADAKAIYVKHCSVCHGAEGKGDGAGAKFMMPKPRDFTSGIYKYKTTPYDEPFASDADIILSIKRGLPGTSMPAWEDVLSDSEVSLIAEYLKKFGKIEPVKKTSLDYGEKVSPGNESIERGKELFKDRCVECHGKEGRGNTSKRLKDDWGSIVWPRSLADKDMFRRGATPEKIFERITAGIPGTPMPSFEDPENGKSVSAKDRWDIANYAAALADSSALEELSDGVIAAAYVQGALPETTNNTKWDESNGEIVPLFPQFFATKKLYYSPVSKVSVSTLYNDTDIAFLLEWTDPSRSVEGDEAASKIAGAIVASDAVAIEFPLSGATYFGMGQDASKVLMWKWQAGKDLNGYVYEYEASGVGTVKALKTETYNFWTSAEYKDGVWRVIIKRPRSNLLWLTPGVSTMLAVGAWDGSNFEAGSLHTASTWVRFDMGKTSGKGSERSPYAFILALFLVTLCVEVLWLKFSRKD